jgi:hypothetical protein
LRRGDRYAGRLDRQRISKVSVHLDSLRGFFFKTRKSVSINSIYLVM